MSNHKKKSSNSSSGGIVAFLLLSAIAIVVTVVSLGQKFTFDPNAYLQELISEWKETEEESVTTVVTEHRRMYEQLDYAEKIIYSAIYDAVSNGKNRCEAEIEKCKPREVKDKMQRAMDAFYYDYPEFFWLNGGCGGTFSSGMGSHTVMMRIGVRKYWENIANKNAEIQKLLSNAEVIAANARKYTNVYDQVKYVHDYLVRTVEYDHVAADELDATNMRASSEQAHTAYGSLVNGAAVCDGYAKGFQLIMNLLGIECEFVIGKANECHAWNYLLLDGKYYWMDVTWDEVEYRNEDGSLMFQDGVSYEYFCIDSEHLERTHMPNETFWIPNCTATDYNFYYREKSHLDVYSFDALRNALENQRGEQIAGVRFSSMEELQRAEDDLFGENYNRQKLADFGFNSHNHNENQYVLHFYRK